MIARTSVRSYGSWPLLLALASLGQAGMAAEAPRLVPGDELPLLEATTLNGELVTLPRDARGHAVVLVVGFSKAAAKTTRQWLESCRTAAAVKSAGYGVYCYDARMLESVPRLFRGSMERGSEAAFPWIFNAERFWCTAGTKRGEDDSAPRTRRPGTLLASTGKAASEEWRPVSSLTQN